MAEYGRATDKEKQRARERKRELGILSPVDGRRVTQCVLAYNESPRSAACLHGQRCVWKRVDVEYVCHFEPVVLRAVLMFNTKRNANVRALFSVRAPTLDLRASSWRGCVPACRNFHRAEKFQLEINR